MTKLSIKLYISNTTTKLHGQKQSWEIIQTRCDQLTGSHGSCQILRCWYTSQLPYSPVSQKIEEYFRLITENHVLTTLNNIKVIHNQSDLQCFFRVSTKGSTSTAFTTLSTFLVLITQSLVDCLVFCVFSPSFQSFVGLFVIYQPSCQGVTIVSPSPPVGGTPCKNYKPLL